MTRRLSGIHAAWHFWFAVSFGGESGVRKVGLGGTHPLTQRYVNIGSVGEKSSSCSDYLGINIIYITKLSVGARFCHWQWKSR
ncbi:DUF3265 domain-containing protein [Vibrio vulnificus]|nr:DUF3265 domain-containing protein [Vibrio vulnificus]